MTDKDTNKIALFTMAVGKDPIYFQSVRRYFPYNNENFGQNKNVDYYVFTDCSETIEGIHNILYPSSVWPYTTFLKNNAISDFLHQTNQWDKYSHIFFIDADFAIGDRCDFFKHDFLLVKPYWNEKKGGGFFYGGKTGYFKILCSLFYDEVRFIYEQKLSVPRDLDEYYLGLFREQYHEQIHLMEMDRQTNTLIFFDKEDLDEKIRQTGKRLFMQPLKAEGRANKTLVIDSQNKKQECIINLEDGYIFNNYTYDFGRLLKIDDTFYRIFWSKRPEAREVLNIETYKIRKQLTNKDMLHSKQIINKSALQTSPIISIVMPVYNVPPCYIRESIDSILNQTFGDFELLIIDDGSTETKGIDLLKTYHDSRIRLITNPHNLIDSLNRGIVESKGKYIARMDADDIMHIDRLKIQYTIMEEEPTITLCGTYMSPFGKNTHKGSIAKTASGMLENPLLMLLKGNMLFHPTVMIRTDFLRMHNLQYENYECAEDYKLWVEMVKSGAVFYVESQPLLHYRISDQQVSIRKKEEQIKTVLRIRKEVLDYLLEINTSTYPSCKKISETLLNAKNEELMTDNEIFDFFCSLFTKNKNSMITE